MLKDRVKVNISTLGTGILTIDSTVAGFQGFSILGSGNVKTYYAITEGINWETGEGTYYSSSETFSRDKVFESSSSGNRINLSTPSVLFVTYPAKTSIYLDSNTSPSSGQYVYSNGDGSFSASSTLKTGNVILDGTVVYTLTDINPTLIDISPPNAIKYLIKAECNGDVQILECLTVSRDSNVYITVYGLIYNNQQLATIDAQMYAGNINLYATATNANTVIKIHKILM